MFTSQSICVYLCNPGVVTSQAKCVFITVHIYLDHSPLFLHDVPCTGANLAVYWAL